MRINSVNSVNQNQQKNQNFGMAVKKDSAEVIERIATQFIREGSDIQKFTDCLAKVKQNQKTNSYADIVMQIANTNQIGARVEAKSSKKTLAYFSQTDSEYDNMSGPDSILKILEDADCEADKFKKFFKETEELDA